MAADDKALAVQYLEGLQKKYCQPGYSNEREQLLKLSKDDAFLQSMFELYKQKHPQLTYAAFLEMVNQLTAATDELVAESRYQNPNWANLLSVLLKELKPAVSSRYGSHANFTTNILFGTLPIGQVNGFAVNIDQSDYKLIILSEGVFGFFHLLTKAIGGLFCVPGSPGTMMPDKLKIMQVLDYSGIVWDRVFDLVMAYAVYQDPYRAKQYADPENTDCKMRDYLRNAVEIFIMGHEFGHIIHGHLGSRKIEHGNANEIILNQLQEFEADNIGLNLSMDVAVNKNIGTAIGFAGADFFLSSMHFFEKCLSLLKNGEVIDITNVYGTHPPFKLRRAFIRELLEKMDEQERNEILDFAHTLDLVLNSLFEKLKPAILNAHKKGIRPGSLWD